MNIEEFSEQYVDKMSKFKPTDTVVVLDPKTGREFNVVGLHHISSSFTGSQNKLVIELE